MGRIVSMVFRLFGLIRVVGKNFSLFVLLCSVLKYFVGVIMLG